MELSVEVKVAASVAAGFVALIVGVDRARKQCRPKCGSEWRPDKQSEG